MLTEFFMERAEIVLAADARGFIGTVPEFPEVRVEAPTPDACEQRLREEIVRALAREALESPACPSCGTTGLPTAFHFCGLCGHKL